MHEAGRAKSAIGGNIREQRFSVSFKTPVANPNVSQLMWDARPRKRCLNRRHKLENHQNINLKLRVRYCDPHVGDKVDAWTA